MTAYSISMEGPFPDRRGRGGRGYGKERGDDPRADRRRGQQGWWQRHEEPRDLPPHERHEHDHDHDEHHFRGRGRRGGPFGPWGPFGPFAPGGPGEGFGFGPEFGFGGPGGPRGRGGRGRSRAGRGDVRAAIVALLAEEPRNGYQIIQEIEQRTGGAWRASSGSVYPALSQLEDEGLIEPVGEGGRKLFTLTADGQAHVAANSEHLGRIWQDATGGPDSRFDEVMRHRELIGQLALAYKQVTQVGTTAQRDEARAVLVKARQALYKILASDEPTEPEDSV
jgi:DNA-binding PadR family transcriptional regulator